MAGSAMV